MDGRLIFQQHIQTTVTFRKALHAVTQCQLHTMLAHFGVDERSHIRIKGVHQLLGSLDDGHIHTQLPQILCYFQTDKAAAHHYSGFRLILIHKFLDPEGILHGTQGEQPIAVHPREARPYRLCAGRKKQLVIAFFKFYAGFQILYRNGLFVRMNGGNFVVYFHMNTETGEEALRGLEG